MKKYLAVLLCLSIFFIPCFTACNSKPNLNNHVVEARLNLFEGENQGLKLSCAYGYTLSEQKNYAMTFKLFTDASTEITYSVSVSLDVMHTETFTLSPITHTLTATIYGKLLSQKSFDVILSYGSEKITISMQSIIPDNVLDVQSALNSLASSQPSLINSFVDEYGTLCVDVCIRIIVRENKAYYYVALTDKSGGVKALLLDGITADVLAVRDIF